MWPVITRELRAEARQRFTYWLRVLGAAIMLLATFALLLGNGYNFSEGNRVFVLQHLFLFCTVWILVPFLVSDSISREKREGTIGLLFLTPLSARDIVVAKSLAHGVRAFSLWLAVVPILTLPFLIGGVSWREVLFSAGILFNSFIWAIAAGLLASSRSKSWMRALLLASILAFVCFLGFILLNDWILQEMSNGTLGWRGLNNSTFGDWAEDSFFMATGMGQTWTYLFSTGPGRPQPQLFLALGYTTTCSLLGFWIILRRAARNLQRTWQEGPPSAGQVWFNHHLCTPVFWLGFFKGWMRRKLERNPVGWLEQRTWSSRITTWAWLAVTISDRKSVV